MTRIVGIFVDKMESNYSSHLASTMEELEQYAASQQLTLVTTVEVTIPQ